MQRETHACNSVLAIKTGGGGRGIFRSIRSFVRSFVCSFLEHRDTNCRQFARGSVRARPRRGEMCPRPGDSLKERTYGNTND